MTNRLSFELKRRGTLATLLLLPGFLTSVMALATLCLATLWTHLVRKWSLCEKGKNFKKCL